MVRLALHRTNATVLQKQSLVTSSTRSSATGTHSKEDPALLLSPSIEARRVLRELALLVKHLREVDQDGRRLEHTPAVVCDRRDTPVGVDLEEPLRLDLVVHLANVGVPDAQLDGSVVRG